MIVSEIFNTDGIEKRLPVKAHKIRTWPALLWVPKKGIPFFPIVDKDAKKIPSSDSIRSRHRGNPKTGTV